MDQNNSSNQHKNCSPNQVQGSSEKKTELEQQKFYNKDETSNSHRTKTKSFSWRFWVPNIIQSFVALVMLGTLIVIYFQLVALREQTQTLRQQITTQSRAWVSIKEANHTKLKEGQKITAFVTFFNSGNTPALNVTIHNNIALRNIPIPTPMPLIPFGNKPSSAVLGPQVLHKSIITSNIIMTEKLIKEIEQGNLHIYMWGIVKYDDIFGQQRETGYCLKNRIGTTNFDVCANNNYAN